jgi:AraC-like DNA-binding protein/CheY-like chemotaxis protein
VQQAIALIEQNCSDEALTPASVATLLDVRLATLDVAFRRALGCTITQFLRERRMEAAAKLLATTSYSIKEVWAAIGYNHASNFDHDFKRHFHMSPTQFRARVIRPAAQAHYVQWRSPAALTATSPGSVQPSVLVVDDDDTSNSILRLHLQHAGYIVAVAESGTEGLRAIKAYSPTAVLLDYRLGDMSGLHVLRTLRAEQSTQTTPVALFSADWDLFDQADEVNALGALIVSKLCDIEQVTRVLAYLAAGRSD